MSAWSWGVREIFSLRMIDQAREGSDLNHLLIHLDDVAQHGVCQRDESILMSRR